MAQDAGYSPYGPYQGSYRLPPATTSSSSSRTSSGGDRPPSYNASGGGTSGGTGLPFSGNWSGSGVWWGDYGANRGNRQDVFYSLNKGYGASVQANPQTWGSIVNQMKALGLIGPTSKATGEAAATVWAQAQELSAGLWREGKKVNPINALKLLAQGGAGGGGGGRGGGGGGPAAFTGTRSMTDRQTRVNLTDAETVNAMVDQLLQQQLGRDATKDEKKGFLAALHRAERANPETAVTTTTATFKAGIQTAQSSKTTVSGGLDQPGKGEVLEGNLEKSTALSQERTAERKANYVKILERMVGEAREA